MNDKINSDFQKDFFYVHLCLISHKEWCLKGPWADVCFVVLLFILHILLLYVVAADIYTNAINASHKLDERAFKAQKNQFG